MSSEDVKFWDETFNEKLKELKILADATGSSKGFQKSQNIGRLKEELNQVKSSVRSIFRIEVRAQPASEQYTYNLRLQEYDKKLEELRVFVENQERLSLMDTENRNPEALLDRRSTRSDMLSATEKIQDKTEESLLSSLAKTREMNEIGVEALKKLEAQNEQIEKIKSKADNIDSELKKAEVLMRGLIRRMMTDKLIICFIGLIFFAVIGLLVFSQLNPESSDSNPVFVGIPSDPSIV